MKPFAIARGVWWVGALHPELRLFDDLVETAHGTSYNAYLVAGSERAALVDAVKVQPPDIDFSGVLLENVRAVTDPARVELLVANHAEPDHSGAFAQAVGAFPNATVYGSRAVERFLKKLHGADFRFQAVKDGDAVDLGGRSLRFFLAPFLHWPDTIVTYLADAKILFPCDAFGAHYCPGRRGEGMYDDECADFEPDRRVYYDCLVRPFSRYVREALAKLGGLDISLIAPSHGPVVRDVAKVVRQYVSWSAQRPRGSKPRVGVVWLSAHGRTRRMAEAAARGVEEAGAEAVALHLTEVSHDELRGLYESVEALLFATPTINRDAPERMWRALGALGTVDLRPRVAAAMGSYGWSGEAVKMIESRLAGFGLKLPSAGLRANFTPTADDLAGCEALGRALAGQAAEAWEKATAAR